MIRYSDYKDLNGKLLNVKFETPDECPMCHGIIEPVYITGNYDDVEHKRFSVFCYCKRCKNTFISRYTVSDHYEYKQPYNYYSSNLETSVPVGFEPVKMPEHVSNLSKRFVTIYNQAAQAEALELDEICGSGYRKSLEILVKDYATHKNPDKETEIKDEIIKPGLSQDGPGFIKKNYSSVVSFFLDRYSLIVNTSKIANKITMMESTAINL